MTEAKILTQCGYHFLWVDGECWMWDLPGERLAMEALASRAHGEVLVAGYGLGLVQAELLRNLDVNSVLTVEICPGVLDECRRVFGVLHGQVMVDDFFDLVEGPRFDCVIGDIWLDIAPQYLQEYLNFLHKAERLLRPGGEVLAWGDECFKVWLGRTSTTAVAGRDVNAPAGTGALTP